MIKLLKKLGNVHWIAIVFIVCWTAAIIVDSYYGSNHTSIVLYTTPFAFIAGLIVYSKLRNFK